MATYRHQWTCKDIKHGIKAVNAIRNEVMRHVSVAKREDLGRKVTITVEIQVEKLKFEQKMEEKPCQDSQTSK